MKLSTRSRYGLRLLVDLAMKQNEGPVQLSSVARTENISEKYLGQLVIQLKTAGLIRSERGKNGGYYLARKPKEMNLREIVEKLEGDLCIVECVGNPQDCERIAFCVTRDVWKDIADLIAKKLEKISLQDLLDRIHKSGNANHYDSLRF